jgi:outer membrane protein
MKATIADMQINIALQKAEVDNARSRLAKSVGLAVDAPLVVDVLPDPTIQSPLTEGLPLLMERAQQTRADLLARRADVDQKYYLYDKASTKYMPKLNLAANGGYKHYVEDHSDGANYRVGLSLDIPLFNGFESIYQKRAAYADAQAAEADVERLEAEIALEVMTYHRSFEAAQEILLLAQDSLQNSVKTFEGILEKYKAGTQSIFDMTAAQRQLAEARIKQSEAKTRWYRTLAQLVYATGTISLEEECATGQ